MMTKVRVPSGAGWYCDLHSSRCGSSNHWLRIFTNFGHFSIIKARSRYGSNSWTDPRYQLKLTWIQRSSGAVVPGLINPWTQIMTVYKNIIALFIPSTATTNLPHTPCCSHFTSGGARFSRTLGEVKSAPDAICRVPGP